jgi:hypothetical protein
MAVFQFRLQVLLDQRAETLKKADEALAASKRELAIERRATEELEEEVSRFEELYRRKRVERVSLRQGGGASLARRSGRLAGLQIDLQTAQASLLSQQVFLDQALDAVQVAKAKVEARRRDVDVLERYREKAEAKYLLQEAYREELEQDEIGNVMHLSKRVKG